MPPFRYVTTPGVVFNPANQNGTGLVLDGTAIRGFTCTSFPPGVRIEHAALKHAIAGGWRRRGHP